METPSMHIGPTAARGGIVTGTAQAIRIGVQLLSVVVLSRLLAPEDFGLVASVMPIITFVALFQNLGLQQAVIQSPRISERQLNQIFWITALVGSISTILVAALSPAVASFYGDARITKITLAAGLPLLLGSLASLPLSLLSRNLRFGQLAINDVFSATAGFLAAILGALGGIRYWSLLLGTAVSAAVALVAAWRTSGWKPRRPELKIDSDILSFGANLTGFNLVNFFARNFDNVLIGKFAGAVELGYYDRAYRLLLFPLQNISRPLTRIMLPLLSRIQSDKARLRSIYLRTNWVLAAATIPGVAAFTCTSEHVVNLLFGERWHGVAPIFTWLGIAGLVQPVSSTTGWLFICQAKTNTMFRWGIYSSVTSVTAFIIGLNWGAVGVAAAYAVSTYMVRLPVLSILLQRMGPVSAVDFLAVPGLFIISSLLAALAYASLTASFTDLSDLTAIVAAVAVSYSIALALMLVFPTPRSALLTTLRNVTIALKQETPRARRFIRNFRRTPIS